MAGPIPSHAAGVAPLPILVGMTKLQLNCDLGEGAGHDAALMPLIDQASIACGGHAGDADTMAHCVALAVQHGVQIGAHPAYPDRAGFGRRSLDLPPDTLAARLREQVGALMHIAWEQGASVAYIKPHGALYHDLWTHEAVRTAVTALARDLDLPLVVQAGRGDWPGGSAGLTVWHEAFADRGYAKDGRLLGRDAAGALLGPEQAATQAQQLIDRGTVTTADGTERPLNADTLCLHGDHPQAQAVSQAVRAVMPRS